VDDLRESLPEHQPRYVVYIYRREHADGRVSYPMCFIYVTPRGTKLLFQVLSLCEYVYKFSYIFEFQIGVSKDNIIIMELRL
jgi:hypothetical protein